MLAGKGDKSVKWLLKMTQAKLLTSQQYRLVSWQMNKLYHQMGFVSEWRTVDCEECTGQLVNKQNNWAETL